MRTCAESVRASPRSWLGLGLANPNPNPNPNPQTQPEPGARVPKELGRWEETAAGSGVWGVTWTVPLGKADVVIKVLDESN